MKAKPFLRFLVILFTISITGYFILVDRIISTDRLIPKSYKQFILDSSVDYSRNKIVLVGGSDAHYGINALMMEEAFKQPVINLGDNGGYPLKHKIFNVLKYIKPGDTVIFSLGWNYYPETRDLHRNYISAISDNKGIYSFYYENLPFLAKIEFAFIDFPYNILLTRIFKYSDKNDFINHQNEAGNEIIRKIKSKNRDTRGSSLKNVKQDNSIVSGATCDSYVFKPILVEVTKSLLLGTKNYSNNVHEYIRIANSLRAINNPYVLNNVLLKNIHQLENDGIIVNIEGSNPSSEFLEALELVSLVRDIGAQVFFAWPIVADFEDSKCYSSNQSVGLTRYAEKIRDAVEGQGYQFLGDYNDSHFPSQCFLNTYAHLTADCADIRTNKLINELALSIEPSNSDYTRNDFDNHLENKLLEMTVSLDIKTKIYTENILKPLPLTGALGNKLSDHILLQSGWSLQEDWGIWSLGYESKIILKINKKRTPKLLIIKGKYFNNNIKTSIYINGKIIGDYVLDDAEIMIPPGLIDGEIIHINLKHFSPISPSSINPEINDPRLIAYGLTFLNIN